MPTFATLDIRKFVCWTFNIFGTMSEIKCIEPKQETQLYDDVCQIIDGTRGRLLL